MIIALTLVGLLVIALGIVYFQPRWIVRAIAAGAPDVFYFANTREPVVALTIDDGPVPVWTPKILDVLRDHGALATFFLISGRVGGNEELVTSIVGDGHELGNHQTRDVPSVRLSRDDFEASLTSAHAVLAQFGSVKWFRPGSGWFTSQMLDVVHRHDYRCALGTMLALDTRIPSASLIAHYVLRNLAPGSIIVLHDGERRGARTLAALQKVLPELDRRGYRTVTLSTLAGLNESDV